MTIFTLFDASGLPTGFFPDDIFPEAPAGSVALTEDQWRAFINNQGLRKWDGSAVVPYTPPAPVPDSVSRAQAKIALSRNSLLASVEQKVSEAGGEVAIWYADALNWRRDNPNVISLGASLGLTSAQIDDLFRQAAQIEA